MAAMLHGRNNENVLHNSGGFRGRARGGRALSLFWVKKEEMTEGEKPAGQLNQDRAPSLGQGLDPTLYKKENFFP